MSIPANISVVLDHVEEEVVRATQLWPAMRSPHEGYAVLLEEVEELKAHVFFNQRKRNVGDMYEEAIQVAAMAIRFAAEVCTEEKGRL